MQLALSCVVLTIPLFFAGIIFSSLIGEARINISTAFAYNLMGALFGGVMEYNSMYFGFAFLYLLARGFYGAGLGVFVEIRVADSGWGLDCAEQQHSLISLSAGNSLAVPPPSDRHFRYPVDYGRT